MGSNQGMTAVADGADWRNLGLDPDACDGCRALLGLPPRASDGATPPAPGLPLRPSGNRRRPLDRRSTRQCQRGNGRR